MKAVVDEFSVGFDAADLKESWTGIKRGSPSGAAEKFVTRRFTCRVTCEQRKITRKSNAVQSGGYTKRSR